MASFAPIFSYFRQTQIQEVAGEIATRLRNSAGHRVDQRIDGMSPAEAQGYIRARIGCIVRTEVRRVVGLNPRMKSQQQTRLADFTMSILVRLVLVDRKIRRRKVSMGQAA